MTCRDILARASDARILVVGDICLDRWCRYDPDLAEASVETALPRCAVVATTVTPGGGGTVAQNLASLGAGRIGVLGFVGADGFGHELRTALEARGIAAEGLIADSSAQTYTYTKLINALTGVEDLPRLDFVNVRDPEPELQDALIDRLRALVADVDAVVVADQAETDVGGSVTPRFREALCEEAARREGVAFVADSRRRIAQFRHIIATPNEVEAQRASMNAFGTVDYRRLARQMEAPALVVTEGADGARLVDAGGCERRLPSAKVPAVVDTCGAGDAFSAGLALALTAGAGLEDAVRFGIIVAAVTVGQEGTGAATPPQVLALASAQVQAR